MNVLAISGTPRERGNSELLLQEALRPFEETSWSVRLLKVREMKLNPCQACDRCRAQGACVIDDDMRVVYESFSWCNALIVATPVYSRNISAQLMAVLDRHYAVAMKRPLMRKPGAAIAVGRGTCGGQSITINAIYNWMLSGGMVCVPGELNGLTAVADAPGDILMQENRLRQARVLGENLLWTARKLMA